MLKLTRDSARGDPPTARAIYIHRVWPTWFHWVTTWHIFSCFVLAQRSSSRNVVSNLNRPGWPNSVYRWLCLLVQARAIYKQSLANLVTLGHNMAYILLFCACPAKHQSTNYDQLKLGWPNSHNQ